MKSFKVAVTVINPKERLWPIWNKVHLSLPGDKSDLKNLQTQLEAIKMDVNQDINRKGLALKDVDINIDFI